MTWFARTLWDMVTTKPQKAEPSRRMVARGKKLGPRSIGTREPRPRSSPMQDRYDALVLEMKQAHGLRIRKWRKSSSGVARLLRYSDGREVRLIEAPYPRGPMSCAIFLHEVGHHAIGLGVFRPRCLEEYRVWLWALDAMRSRGFNVTSAVEQRVRRSMEYAVAKALRRGAKSLPPELDQFR